MSVVFAKIQMRRGTAAQWAAANPVLAQGEMAFETDTGLTKIGDGATAYASLPSYATYDQMLAAKEALDEAALDVAAVEASRVASAASAATASTKANEAAGSAAAALASEQSIVAKVNQAEQARIDAIAYAAVAEEKADEIVASANAAAADASAADADRIAAEAARTGAEAAQAIAQGAAAGALASEVAADASADVASGAAASALAIYGSVDAQNTAVAVAQAQASLAAGFAASAASVAQQDLSGVTAQALHRSPNAITSMFIYDTSKDSDGGAWTEKCQHTSWWNEAINGKWLGAWANEISARVSNASVGPELFPNGSFSDASNLVFTPSPECTLSIVNGRLRVTRIASGYGGASVTISGLTVGKLYRVQIDCINGSLTALHRVRRDGFSAAYYGDNQSAGNVFVSQGTSLLVDLGAAQNSASGFFEYDNISVREVTAINGVAGDYFQFSGDGRFYRLNKNLLINTATLGTQTQLLGPGTYTLSSTTGSSGSVAVSGAATASHTAGGAATTFTVASAGNVTFTVTGSVLTAMCEQGSVATTYEANGASRITEVFRGNKRDFPRLAGIVAEGRNVTIYDLTEPGRPMWMTFAEISGNDSYRNFLGGLANRNAIRTVHMLNGLFAVSGPAEPSSHIYGHLRIASFAEDSMTIYVGGYNYRARSNVSISERNATTVGFGPLGGGLVIPGAGLPDGRVNAIAMTVLPDAPVDPVTGLRVPTIAVATGGGVSVIKHNGTVVNSASTGAYTSIQLTPYALHTNSPSGGRVWNIAAPLATLGAGFALSGSLTDGAFTPIDNATIQALVPSRSRLFRRESNQPRVRAMLMNETATLKGLAFGISNTFNTGWMTGDIRRCFLSDTEVGELPRGEIGWPSGTLSVSNFFATTGYTLTDLGDRIRIERNAAGFVSYPTIDSGIVVPNVPYSFEFEILAVSSGATAFYTATNGGAAQLISNSYPGAARLRLTATPTGAGNGTARFSFAPARSASPGNALTGDFIEISKTFNIVRAVSDRSYRAGHQTVTGTLTRAQLASSTSLVGYSGFSAANYLREPYSADLDFGTGEWTASAWVNIPATLPLSNSPVTGPNLVTNGGFDADTNWTKGTGISISGGSLVFSSAAVPQGASQTGIALKRGFAYLVTIDAAITTGSDIRVRIGNASDTLDVGVANGSNSRVIAVPLVPNNDNWSVSIFGANGPAVTATFDNLSIVELGPAAIFDRAAASGPRLRLGVDAAGRLTATAFDGTTTRTVTTTAAYNTATWLKARVNYTTDGTLAILVNGREVAATRGAPLLTLNNASAVLTIGNSFALDAPFPGSIALLKLGATVPTPEQATFMFEQEKQMFRAGALSVLPDSGAIVDMAYDDATDRWVAISATNESYWTGLVRNSVQAVPAGSFSRVVAGSGLELAARTGTNPGVDVTIPAYGLREELVRRAEAAARLSRELVAFDFVGGFTANTTNGSAAITNVAGLTYPGTLIGARVSGAGIPANTRIVGVSGTTIYLSAVCTATATGVSVSLLDFNLPVAFEARAVLSAGALRREGSTADYTRLYDGFLETIRFAVAPGATAWVQIQATRGTMQ